MSKRPNCNEIGKMHMWNRGRCHQCGVYQDDGLAEAICEVLTKTGSTEEAESQGKGER